MLNETGTPVYSVSYNDKEIIKPSIMGFVLSNNDDFSKNFQILGSEKKSFDETWKPVWGEVNQIRNHYNEVTIHLKQNTTNRLLDISF